MEITFSKDRNTVISYVAFFDLDLTITKSISGRALAKELYRKNLLTHLDILKAVLLSLAFRFRLKDPLKIIDKMVGWVRGIPEDTMIDLCSEVCHNVLLPSVYREAIEQIESHKAKNARVVILSSALTSVCREMAKNLNIDDTICSELEVKNGFLTGHTIGHLCFGEEKAIRLLAYCEKNNFLPSDAWYYADSISDFNALCSVGNPVCINPDRKLKKAALKRNWKILNWSI
jgi:HAD superfamily hydrolase (TIGR01490 family)